MQENIQKINTVIVHRIAPAKRRPSYAWPWRNLRHLIKMNGHFPLSPDQTERGKSTLQRGVQESLLYRPRKGEGEKSLRLLRSRPGALYIKSERCTHQPNGQLQFEIPLRVEECANTHTPVAHTHTHPHEEHSPDTRWRRKFEAPPEAHRRHTQHRVSLNLDAAKMHWRMTHDAWRSTCTSDAFPAFGASFSKIPSCYCWKYS